MLIESLAQYFNTIEDPRCGGKVEHHLRDILVVAVCRDHRRARTAGSAHAGEQHRDARRHGRSWPRRLRRRSRWKASGGRQTAIAEKILARGGDYLLTLKGNHKLAHAAVVEHFDQHCFGRGASGRADCDAFDDTHGRLARRRVFASTDAAALDALSGWPGLRTVLAVESIRSVNAAPCLVCGLGMGETHGPICVS